jgi:uncharacterized protein involved in tolerance to divalent cations
MSMSGQTKTSKKQIVEDFIQRVNPYEKPQPIAFDLRGYAKYVSDKQIKTADITPEVMNMFVTKTGKV